MYSKKFEDLVNVAFSKSDNLSIDEKQFGNPYYIGFGNPNSKVLILGKEKGFDVQNTLTNKQFEYESLKNPNEWKYYIENKIPRNTSKYHESEHYINAFVPYLHKNKSGHTWTKYEVVLKYLFPEITGFENDFFNHAFISEVNYQPSKLSKIKRFQNPERLNLLEHDYFKSFPITILGCGNYLSHEQIQQIFDVAYFENLSKPRQKLVIFKNSDRILVQTRQLSFDINGDYLKRIADQVSSYI
ncbi:hypothetical protein HUK80_17605 [Flavobacterium sp. MAH-1]|uniref:Uncharacterized protein n=1 Tax=Flavobacterium agri TaxID=2743471 RepID=A0A7Y8Y584_9FLAO|nr:hypothetical protein [Flavobacterium agri]NUY82723.1 hypothetical protein [Flavobacterium agri]NYA72746.1 hypothetical protein [Flavobacterium agri]